MKLPAFLFAATIILAQPSSPPSVIYVTSDPAGACAASAQLRFNTSNGKLWGCNAGTWSQIGGGGGSGTVSSATAGQLGYYTAATTVGGSAGTSWDNTTRTLTYKDAANNSIFVFNFALDGGGTGEILTLNPLSVNPPDVATATGTIGGSMGWNFPFGANTTITTDGTGGDGGAWTTDTGNGGVAGKATGN